MASESAFDRLMATSRPPAQPEPEEPEVEFPGFTEIQLRYLEQLAPDRSPRLDEEDRVIWYNTGAAELVAHLRRANQELLQKNQSSPNVQHP